MRSMKNTATETLPRAGLQITLNHVYWTGLKWELERLAAIVERASFTADRTVYGIALLTTGGGMDFWRDETDGSYWHGSRRTT